MEQIDLITLKRDNASTDAHWSAGDNLHLTSSPRLAYQTLKSVLENTVAPWLLFWDPALGAPPEETARELASRHADGYHGGLILGLAGLPEEIDYIYPQWWLNVDVDKRRPSTNWRVTLRAFLVRTDVLQTLGQIDPAFRTLDAAGLELGLRLIRHGAVVYHEPSLIDRPAEPRQDIAALDEHDRFLILLRHFPRKWVSYAATRRAISTARPLRTWSAYRAATSSAARSPAWPRNLLARPATGRDAADASVSVVLPTLGRYELVRRVLDQLATQTVRPLEVICVDQNDPAQRDPSVYEGREGLSVDVIYQNETGQWLARNAAVRQARGEYLCFVDDDSEIKPNFVEAHLEGLWRYDADISTGASLAVIGAPVPDNYGFYRVADQFDSGNGLCHRDVFREIGAFDYHYDRMRSGDSDFGVRAYMAGRLVLHNPDATRIHLKAAEGGLRTFGSLDSYRQRGRRGPLPLPSVVYFARRFFSPRQVREALLIGLLQSVIPYELKRRATGRQWLRYLATEILYLPSTILRVRQSWKLSGRMLAEGPKIPAITYEQEPRVKLG